MIKYPQHIVLVTALILLAGACGKMESSDQSPAPPTRKTRPAVDEDSPSGALENGQRVIDMKARKFEFVPGTIVVRQDEDVRLRVTSQDTLHGLRIEAYDIDRALHPNEEEVIDFHADKPGCHEIICSIYCGSGHDSMHGTLIVLAPDEDGISQ